MGRYFATLMLLIMNRKLTNITERNNTGDSITSKDKEWAFMKLA